VQAFLRRCNPWALRGMAERLWEAYQRGLWPNPDPAILTALRRLIHTTEALIEQGEPIAPP